MFPTFRLVVQSGPIQGKTFPLEKNELFIGRDLANDIVINDPEMSRRHARIFMGDYNSWMLEDLGSPNGSFINGQRLVGPHALRPGEVITFGERINLVFEGSDPGATVVAQRGPATPTFTPTATPPPVQQPAQQYAPPPVQHVTPPPPAYSARQEVVVDEVPPKRKFPMWLIILLIAFILICLCVIVPVLIDATNSWCWGPLRFITDIIAPLLGRGTCP